MFASARRCLKAVATALLLGALAMLGACAPLPQPAEGDGPPQTRRQAPAAAAAAEVELNLPGEEEFAPDTGTERDYNLLDKGLNALAAGDHIAAIDYFKRYQRLESSALAAWEASIAIAFDSMLSTSPFYDPEAAQRSFVQLMGKPAPAGRVHPTVLLLRNALAAMVGQQLEIDKVRSDNAVLADDLRKREEALKRLRELALGRAGDAP